MTHVRAAQIATKTADAYSAGGYTSWLACVKMLAKRGLDDASIEAVLRSKWMRWARDCSDNPSGKASSLDLARFMDDPRNECTPENIKRLVAGTL